MTYKNKLSGLVQSMSTKAVLLLLGLVVFTSCGPKETKKEDDKKLQASGQGDGNENGDENLEDGENAADKARAGKKKSYFLSYKILVKKNKKEDVTPLFEKINIKLGGDSATPMNSEQFFEVIQSKSFVTSFFTAINTLELDKGYSIMLSEVADEDLGAFLNDKHKKNPLLFGKKKRNVSELINDQADYMYLIAYIKQAGEIYNSTTITDKKKELESLQSAMKDHYPGVEELAKKTFETKNVEKPKFLGKDLKEGVPYEFGGDRIAVKPDAAVMQGAAILYGHIDLIKP